MTLIIEWIRQSLDFPASQANSPTQLHQTHRGCTAPLRCLGVPRETVRYELSDTSHSSAVAVTEEYNFSSTYAAKYWVQYISLFQWKPACV